MIEIMRWLQSKGKAVSAYIFINYDPSPEYEDRYLADLGKQIGIDMKIIPFSSKKLSSRPRQTILKKVIKFLTNQKIDYAVTTDSDFMALSSVSALGIPGIHFFRSLANVKAYVGEIFHVKMLKKRNVISVSRFIRDRLNHYLGVDSYVWPPIPLVYNQLTIPNENPYRNRGCDIKTIGYSSSGKHKGDDIVNELIQRLPEYKFITMGGGYTHSFQQLPANLEYLGEVKDTENFYRKIDLLLVPSIIEEAYPRVILEASAFGIPLVANNVGGIPEAAGNNGILIDVEIVNSSIQKTVDSYISAIDEIFSDQHRYLLYRKKALDRASEFSTEQRKRCPEVFKLYFDRS
jgi:glycosyltransferase involved in cell wall biosynthesis